MRFIYSNMDLNTKNNPLVSVCIPTYQHAAYIGECLDSVLMQQTDFPFEIILGEDESTDGAREICQEYAEKYPHLIRLFLRSRKDVIYINGHPTGRFNFVANLKAARGKYIALLEGDDYWTDPQKLQKQVDILESKDDIIACHHWQKYAVIENDKYIEIDAPTNPGQGYLPQQIATVKEIFENKLRVKTRTIMFRNVIGDGFFPDWFYKVAFGDVPLSFLLGKHGNFYFIDEPMAVYRQTGKGVSTHGRDKLTAGNWMKLHYKHWINIWDYANRLYENRYKREASKTIEYFYSVIIQSNHFSIKTFCELAIYTFFYRHTNFNSKISSFIYLLYNLFNGIFKKAGFI